MVEHTDGAERPDEADGIEALQRIEQAERLAVVGDYEPAPRKRRRWPRRLALAGVLLLALAALLPTAAGPVLRPRLARALGDALGATVRIDDVGLSWFGGQRIDGLRILDDRLREHAALDLRLDRSLLDLARSWKTLGTLTARGTLDLEQRPDGSVAPLPAPSAGGRDGGGGPVRLPAGLSAALRVELDRVRFTDRAGVTTEAGGVVLDAALTGDGGVTMTLDARSGGGSVSARGAAAGVFAADGALDAANASGTIDATLTDLPASLVALALGDRAGLLGDRVSGTLAGELSARGGVVGVTLDSAGASAEARATIRRGDGSATVSFAEPAVVRIAPETVAALVPDLAALTGDEGPFRIDALPGATLELRRGEAVVGGGSSRLGEASFDVALRVDAVSGWLDGKPWSIEPLEVGASSLRLADGIAVEGVTTAQLDGRHAGVLVLSGSGLRVLDESGGLLTEASLYAERGRASLEMNDVKTAVVAPLLNPVLEPLGLRLDRDLGETVAFEAAFGSQPRPTLVATLDAERVSARAGLRLRDGVLETDDAGIRVEMASAAPVLSGVLTSLPEDWAVRLDSGASVEAWARGVSVDLAGLVGGGQGGVGLDLRAVRGEVDVRVGESAGGARIAGVDRAFVLRPVSFTADLRNIEREAAATLSTGLWLDGAPAGDLTVSLRATDLVDERGSLRPGVPPIEGEVAVREALLTSLGPLWPGMDMARSIGERGTVIVTGRRDAKDAVRVETEIRASNLRGGGSLAIEGGVLSVIGEGVTVRVLDVSPLLSAIAPAGLTARPGGTATLTVSGLRLGLGGGESAPEARATLALADLAAETDAGGALLVDRLDLAGGVLGGSGVIEVNGSASFAGQPLLAAGRLTAADLVGVDGRIRLLRSVLSGRVDLTGVPVALAELTAPRTVAEVGVELIGTTVDAALIAESGRVEFRAGDAAGRLMVQAHGDLGGGGASVRGGLVRLVVDPERARQAQLRRVQNGRDPGPRLTAPAEVGVTFTGFEIASDDAVRLGGSSTVRVEASGALTGLALGTETGPDGSPVVRRSGELGIDGLLIESVVPVGALAGGESAELRGTVRGVLSGRGGQPMGRVSGDLAAGFASGSLDGAVTVDLRMSDIDTGALDEALLTDGLLSGAVGARGAVSGRLGGIAEAGAVRDAGLELSVESPRLRTLEAVTLDVRADRVTLSRPASLVWTVDPVFATRHLLHQEAGAERVRLGERSEVTVRLDALSLGRGADPLDPGIFAASGRVGAPSLAVQWLREGAEAWDAAEIGPLSGTVAADSGGVLTVSLDLAQGTDHRIDADATIHPPHGAEGGPSVDVLIEAPRLPTMLVDGALDLSGGLAELVGPTTTLRVFAQGLSRESGKLNVSANGDRAGATVIGEVRGGVFRATEPITAEVNAIRPELGARLSRVVPVLGEVTKQIEDGPATARIENLSLPLDGPNPVSGLEADFSIDIGTARFRTSSAFGSILRLAQQRAEGEVGRRVEPMVGSVRGGVIRYERFSVPLGEFTLRSEGSYDLGTSHVDVTTFVPVGALSDQAMGVLNTGLGSQLARIIPGLERLTMIPWRVKGPPGGLSVQPDLDTLRRDLTRALNPLNLITGVLGG